MNEVYLIIHYWSIQLINYGERLVELIEIDKFCHLLLKVAKQGLDCPSLKGSSSTSLTYLP